MTTLEQMIGLSLVTSSFVRAAILVACTFILFFICRRLLFFLLSKATLGLSNVWVLSILDKRFLFQTSWILPIIALAAGIRGIAGFPEPTARFIENSLMVLLTVICVRSLSVLFVAIQDNYSKLEISRNRPIKGFLQVCSLLIYMMAAILIFSIIFDKSPWVFLSGLGAATAVLLLVFRDTILSFVAGIQLTSNRLIHVGDWIEMPQFSADGDVVDIALNSVSVQNWDKTITVIPTHKFLEHSFKNWRGMQQSGGRRIKRAVWIDINSIDFLQPDAIQRLRQLTPLKGYLESKLVELDEFNRSYQSEDMAINSRRLTNVGTFRAYLQAYLKQHPLIHQGMTQLVRQLAPTAQGLPIEIYVFTNTVKWAEYEPIQSDIFDHIYAVLPAFGLRAFQDPTGHDFSGILSTLATSGLVSKDGTSK